MIFWLLYGWGIALGEADSGRQRGEWEVLMEHIGNGGSSEFFAIFYIFYTVVILLCFVICILLVVWIFSKKFKALLKIKNRGERNRHLLSMFFCVIIFCALVFFLALTISNLELIPVNAHQPNPSILTF